MVPVNIQTLIVSTAPAPSIIVLNPVEKTPQTGKSRIVPIWVGVNEATQMGIALEKARFSTRSPTSMRGSTMWSSTM